jgi:hypothetical protein
VSIGLRVDYNDIVGNSVWAESHLLYLVSSETHSSVEVEMDVAGGLCFNASIGVQNVAPVSQTCFTFPRPVDNELVLIELSEHSLIFPVWVLSKLGNT